MGKRRLPLLLALLACADAQASNWQLMLKVYPKDALMFFDMDTATRQGDVVTVWTKSFYDLESVQSDGIWSFAERAAYNCSKRTILSMTSSSYDHDGAFIRTLTGTGKAQDIVPDSVADGVVNTVCKPGFPKAAPNGDFTPTVSNDPRAATDRYFKYVRDKKADPAPQ